MKQRHDENRYRVDGQGSECTDKDNPAMEQQHGGA